MITRRRVLIALGALVLLLLTFAAGRYSRPARVEVREHVVTQVQTVEKIVNHDVVHTEVVHDKATAKDVVTKIVWQKAPDGAVTKTETITDLTKTASQTETNQTHEVVRQKDLTQVVKVDATKSTITVTTRPSWSVAVMPGLDVRGLVSDGLSGLSSASLLKRGVLGASVERRVLGPVFGGVWGNTAGAGGLSVRVEF